MPSNSFVRQFLIWQFFTAPFFHSSWNKQLLLFFSSFYFSILFRDFFFCSSLSFHNFVPTKSISFLSYLKWPILDWLNLLFVLRKEREKGELNLCWSEKSLFWLKPQKYIFNFFWRKKWSKKAPIHPEMASYFIFSLVVSPPRLTSRWPHREQNSNKNSSSKTRTKWYYWLVQCCYYVAGIVLLPVNTKASVNYKDRNGFWNP